jgi:hypothetical protein
MGGDGSMGGLRVGDDTRRLGDPPVQVGETNGPGGQGPLARDIVAANRARHTIYFGESGEPSV